MKRTLYWMVCGLTATLSMGSLAATPSAWDALVDYTQLPTGARVEISPAQQEANQALYGTPSCPNPSYALPKGSRLWGRTLIQANCPGQMVWVAVDAKVFAPVAVASVPVKFQDLLNEDNTREEELEISKFPASSPWLTVNEVIGKQAGRQISSGAPIKADMVRIKPAVNTGDAVRLALKGAGFQIMADAVAMTSAQLGQTIRVKTAQGKVLTGTARSDLIVEVAL